MDSNDTEPNEIEVMQRWNGILSEAHCEHDGHYAERRLCAECEPKLLIELVAQFTRQQPPSKTKESDGTDSR